jgi:hypothetical protein
LVERAAQQQAQKGMEPESQDAGDDDDHAREHDEERMRAPMILRRAHSAGQRRVARKALTTMRTTMTAIASSTTLVSDMWIRAVEAPCAAG